MSLFDDDQQGESLGGVGDEARTQPAYRRARQVQRFAIMSFPVVLVWGAILVVFSQGMWAVWLWLAAAGIAVAVFLAAEAWKVWVFGRYVFRRRAGTLPAEESGAPKGARSSDTVVGEQRQ